MTEVDVFKDLPGYTAILRAVLKNQIQFLVNQLSEATGEESLILTASVSDGSFTQLGSERGKTFLQKYDSIKTQFLGFCLSADQATNSTEAVYNKQFLSDDYRKTVSFSENSQSSSVDSYPQQSKRNQNNLRDDNQVRKKRRKSIPHKAHTNFAEEPSTSQDLVSSQDGVKPVAMFMTKEPLGVVDVTEVDSDQSQEVPDQPIPTEGIQNEGQDLSLTTDDQNKKESPKINSDTVRSEEDISAHEAENQSDTDSLHTEYSETGKLVVIKKEPELDMDSGPSELDSLQYKVQALESEMHLDPMHSGLLGNPISFACSFCLKSFRNGLEMRYHERTHHRSKSHTCDICQKSFTRKFNMDTHRQLHFEIRQHVCKICAKGFTRRDRLLMHYHTNHRKELGMGDEDELSLERLVTAVDSL